jgi:hypothetical protein
MITNPPDDSAIAPASPFSGAVTNPHLAILDRSWAQLPDDTKDVVNRTHELLGLRGVADGASAMEAAANQPTSAPAAPQRQVSANPPLSGISNPEENPLPGMVGVRPKMLTEAPAASSPTTPDPETPLPMRTQRMMTSPTVQTPAQKNYSRLTAPPITSGPMAHTSQDMGRAGTGQVHSPWARIPLQILDAVGSGLFPRISQFIPGTEAHHGLEVARAENAVGQESKQADEESKRTAEAATTKLTEAQIPHVQAETTALGNPKDEFALFHQQNPTGTVADFVKQQESGKDPTSPYQIWHREPANAGKGYMDFVKEEAASKPPTNELELYVKTHPDEANPLAGYEHEKQNITSKPLTKETADALNANYNTLAKQYKAIPADQFHEGMTSAEATQIKAAMLGAIAGTQKGQTITINQGKAADAKAAKQDAATQKSANDVHKRLTTGFDKLVAQSDALDQAISEIGGNAPGQAVGTIKSIVGLAGGQGSGVRITQAELDSLVKARGLADSFGGWVSGLSGTGKMDAHQVQQIKDILHEAKAKADEKRQTYFDSLKDLGGATSPTAVREIEDRFNESLMHGGNAPANKTSIDDLVKKYGGK